MDYEKKYNEAVERARELAAKWTGKNKDFFIGDYAYIFPELRESEDERIRKDIRLVVESSATKYFKETGQMPEWYDRIVAYLETQKEQKPAEWSEKDEKNLELVTDCVYEFYPDPVMKYKLKDWLTQRFKFIHPQPHWKPSDEHPEVDLEKEIRSMWERCGPTDEGMGVESAYIHIEAFDIIARHFAKWGAEHTPLPEDTVLFNKGVEEGKRLMMEEAVEGDIINTAYPTTIQLRTFDHKFNNGDKVRIIIVKE